MELLIGRLIIQSLLRSLSNGYLVIFLGAIPKLMPFLKSLIDRERIEIDLVQ